MRSKTTALVLSDEDRAGAEYQGYAKGVSAERAAELFEHRHGYAPLEVLDGGTIWLAGPLDAPPEPPPCPTDAPSAPLPCPRPDRRGRGPTSEQLSLGLEGP
jgi:hypothetical protein